jgi:hypothetical protein
MKNLFSSIIIALLLGTSINAQTPIKETFPQGMKYQAVARDISGDIIANQQVFLQVQLQSNIKSQQVYYSETHTVTTNQFGLFSLVIGEGVSQGDFTKIPWSSDDIWMGVAIKDSKKNNYVTISNSKLLAVPYAFHAASASKLTEKKGDNGIGEGVPAQVWSLKGNKKTDPETDKLGTTDYTDLVFVTDNLERLRIDADGKITLGGSLDIAEDLYVGRDVFLNYNDTISPQGKTINYGDFSVKGKMTVDSISKFNGQVTIQPELEEIDEDEFGAYPLRIKGSNHGIAISVNTTNPTLANNYITFYNSNLEPNGRIEGQERYVIKQTMLAIVESIISGDTHINLDGIDYYYDVPGDLKELRRAHFDGEFAGGFVEKTVAVWISAVKTAIAAISGVFTYCVEDCDDIITEAISYLKAQLSRAWFVSAYVVTDVFSTGVTYESTGADYAEWLKKLDPSESISFGEVVGIKGGLISKKFKDADQYFAITSNPIIVGAMPKVGNEKNYKKVALMGQIPVQVIGKTNIGDYILPSGNGDGIAKSVNPNKMIATDYSKIIGVAWSNSKPDKYLSNINTAVGFNTNHMGMMINNMQTVMNSIQEEIVNINPDYKPVLFQTSRSSMIQPVQTTETTSIDKSNLDQISDASNLIPLTPKDIDRMVEANSGISDCFDGCNDGIVDWDIDHLGCYISCFLAENITAQDMEDFNIDINSNVVMDIFLKSEKFIEMVNSHINNNRINKIFDQLREDDFRGEPEMKKIIEVLRNGGLLQVIIDIKNDNTNQDKYLFKRAYLTDLYTKYERAIDILNRLMRPEE